ncbi:MAG: bifunctional diaminohydroxyphosphoribosylaminopyrimidine deaminase/5-amino-6-(5-phosphoribosylamino)uracil reductase RibD [Candidatus Omnitrophica bacterium]|nr:bifunctional diaminohydroxyphosphoribosylaminopyrimidine deaminase/5-amino-6-(5-phosphoribosylamino)uracil reductase RibD [Candidatus Omnitrophota bacterium]
MRDDKFFMKFALTLAKKGAGKTSPNPMVGAVVVKNGVISGKGYHKKAGLEHAEIAALRAAGKKARAASLYVNLEPCRHFGRTPPCTKAIIKSGVSRIIAAMKDPNPLNNGKGFNELKRAGIKIRSGVLRAEAEKLNEVFIKYITTRMPFVTVKAAMSMDGKIATRTGDSKWISCERSRRLAHRLRYEADAVMVGAGTVMMDDPLLTVRTRVNGKQPIKIIIDSELSISPKSKIFSQASPAKVIIAVTNKAAKNKIKKFEKLNCEIITMREKNGKGALLELMRELGRRGITSILAEGGGELLGSLVDQGLADKFLFFIAPKIVGGRNAKTPVEGEGVKKISQALSLKNMNSRKIGTDLLIEAYPLKTKHVHGHN